MKTGDEVLLKNQDLLEPLVGRLVDVTIAGETKRVRIIEVAVNITSCKVVPNETKD